MREVRVALIGNSFASRAQLPALRHVGGNTVVGIAGADGKKARGVAAEWGIPHATDDWTELLTLDPDLVLVTTPVHLHQAMVLAVLETRAAVLCEKPFALDARQAAEMARAAEGRAAWIDHQLRWSPHQRELRRRIRAGEIGAGGIGPIRHATFELLFPTGADYGERPYRWWFDAERGGGMLGAIGSHLVDLVRWHLGEVEAVRCHLETFVPERRDETGALVRVTADEYAALTLRMGSGALVDVRTSVAIPSEHPFSIQVDGEEGALRLLDGDRLFAAPHGEDAAPIDVDPPLPSHEELGMLSDGIFERCLPLYLLDVVAAVRAGASEIPEAATFADGLAVQLVLDAARRSAAGDGGWVGC